MAESIRVSGFGQLPKPTGPPPLLLMVARLSGAAVYEPRASAAQPRPSPHPALSAPQGAERVVQRGNVGQRADNLPSTERQPGGGADLKRRQGAALQLLVRKGWRLPKRAL